MHCKRIANRDQVKLPSLLLRICSLGLFLFCCVKTFGGDKGWVDSSKDVAGEEIELPNSLEASDSRTKPLKTILWYNDPHFIITEVFGTGNAPFVFNNCPVSDCVLHTALTDEIPMEDFDAVIFHAVRLRNITKDALTKLTAPDLNRRSPHQRYIFYNLEPPLSMRMVDWELYANFYNWTMTYKKDSDIWMPYGKVEPLPHMELPLHPTMLLKHEKEIAGLIAGKHKLVAWFVSKCFSHSAREFYVQNMRAYINIDIYGTCGDLSCPRKEGTHYSEESCYEMVEKTYKFYLSFENSFCTEYVTEKLFSVLKRHIVPVVYGNTDYKSLLPEHSYINALNYTPKELANYLEYLDKNNTAYQEYFWWKPYYRVYGDWDVMSPITMCKLCEKLHEPVVPKTYSDIGMVQGSKANCLQRTAILNFIVQRRKFLFNAKWGRFINNHRKPRLFRSNRKHFQ